MIRQPWVYGVGAAATVFYGGTVALRAALGIRWFPRFAERATANWSRTILWGAGVRVDVENPEHLAEHRGQILVSNHQSWFDVFALAASLPVPFSFVGKKELNRVPFLGHAWEKVGHVAIDRSDHQSALAALGSMDGQLHDEGRTIIMFPEGTRSPTGELTRFKKGAFVMAIKAQTPVVPVALVGTRRIMKKGDWKILRGHVTVRVGEPIPTAGLTLRDRDDLSARAREAILGLREAAAATRSEAAEGQSEGPQAAGPIELAT